MVASRHVSTISSIAEWPGLSPLEQQQVGRIVRALMADNERSEVVQLFTTVASAYAQVEMERLDQVPPFEWEDEIAAMKRSIKVRLPNNHPDGIAADLQVWMQFLCSPDGAMGVCAWLRESRIQVHAVNEARLENDYLAQQIVALLRTITPRTLLSIAGLFDKLAIFPSLSAPTAPALYAAYGEIQRAGELQQQGKHIAACRALIKFIKDMVETRYKDFATILDSIAVDAKKYSPNQNGSLGTTLNRVLALLEGRYPQFEYLVDREWVHLRNAEAHNQVTAADDGKSITVQDRKADGSASYSRTFTFEQLYWVARQVADMCMDGGSIHNAFTYLQSGMVVALWPVLCDALLEGLQCHHAQPVTPDARGVFHRLQRLLDP